jgi:hypothetical protein
MTSEAIYFGLDLRVIALIQTMLLFTVFKLIGKSSELSHDFYIVTFRLSHFKFSFFKLFLLSFELFLEFLVDFSDVSFFISASGDTHI